MEVQSTEVRGTEGVTPIANCAEYAGFGFQLVSKMVNSLACIFLEICLLGLGLRLWGSKKVEMPALVERKRSLFYLLALALLASDMYLFVVLLT
jgi:hypothetical protein